MVQTTRAAMQLRPRLSTRLGAESGARLGLPDKVPDGMHTLFVGVNPGIRSATIGHYFAGHTNYFWKLMHASGIWPTPLAPQDDDLIVKAGFGFTDVCKRPTPGIADLSGEDFYHSPKRIEQIVKAKQPKVVVFVSKTAIRGFAGEPDLAVEYGVQSIKIQDSKVFLVPSTSGASLGDTSYEVKLKWFSELRSFLHAQSISHQLTVKNTAPRQQTLLQARGK